jgi:hypothetical protein
MPSKNPENGKRAPAKLLRAQERPGAWTTCYRRKESPESWRALRGIRMQPEERRTERNTTAPMTPDCTQFFSCCDAIPAWTSRTIARPRFCGRAARDDARDRPLDEYVKHVHLHPGEIKALYQDMLINVTSFFRNPRMFDALKIEVFPAILNNRLTDAPIRVWTPGCSSVEETYSIAIALLEFLGDRAHQIPLQFFGTDVSESTITKARSGVYPENILGDVSAERLRRFAARRDILRSRSAAVGADVRFAAVSRTAALPAAGADAAKR